MAEDLHFPPQCERDTRAGNDPEGFDDAPGDEPPPLPRSSKKKSRIGGGPDSSAPAEEYEVVPFVPADEVELGPLVSRCATSAVYSGRCFGREAAIKLFYPAVGTSWYAALCEGVMYMFLKRKGLQGTVIPACMGMGELGDDTFLATSWVPGTLLKEVHPLTTDIKQAVETAVAQLHHHHVVHGDLSGTHLLLVEGSPSGSPGQSSGGGRLGSGSGGSDSSQPCTEVGSGSSVVPPGAADNQGPTGSQGPNSSSRVVVLNFGTAWVSDDIERERHHDLRRLRRLFARLEKRRS